MNFIQKIKEKRKYKKSPEYLEYLSMLDLNKVDIARVLGYYEDATKKLSQLLDAGIDKESKEFLDTKETMQRWYYTYNENVKMREFIRPNSKEEIEDRNRIADTFGKELKSILGEESNIRFHGTPIYFAKEIIESGKICSSADIYDGYIKSTDMSGEFSASDINSIDRTINYFTDFGSYRRCLPCGVLFILREKEGDKELRSSANMQNVSFFNNPEQLVGVLGTSEVKDRLIEWMNAVNLDSSKVFTYDEFLEYAKANNIESIKTL